MTETFNQLNLPEFLEKAIFDMEFKNPTVIQKEAIPRIIEGKDIIAMAPTGSGKTVAFAIPMLTKIDTNSPFIQALILCPTRELAIQAHREIEKLTKYNEDLKSVSVYGGQQIDRQLNALKRKPQIIIATPGRLMDHMRQGSIDLKGTKIAILDEADEMLDMGFREDIHTILEKTNKSHQTVLFSATMEKNIMEIAKKFQHSPEIIDVMDNLQNAPDIEQLYLETNDKDKPELITRLLNLHNINLGLVFCNTKTNVDKTVEILKTRGFFADAIHGDMNQNQREKVMRGFKNGSIKILVATDVAGRGIDVKNVEAVFNYDLPRDDEDYIHRIGRTGRAGKSGVAFTFVSKRELNALKRIEKSNGLKIKKIERPTVEEIDVAKFDNYANEVREVIKSGELEFFREKVKEITAHNCSELDAAAALYLLLAQKEQAQINRQQIFEECPEDDYKSRKRSNSGRGRSYRGNDRDEKRQPKFFEFRSKSRNSSKRKSRA